MNLKNLIFGAALLATTSLASALDIYIVGSNGDRSATQKAILNILTTNGDWSFRGVNGSAQKVGATVTTPNNATNSNHGAWKGTYASQPVVIRVAFIGAAGAVGALATPTTTRYVVSDGTYAVGALNDPYGTSAVAGVDYNNHLSSFGFSTNFQETTPFNGGSYDTLQLERVGVSPIVFVASQGFPGTNLTSQQAQLLFSTGSLPASLVTGNSADSNKIVYAIGRNTDAGQRFSAYGEIGLGTAATVKVWQPTITGQITDPTTSIKYGGTVTSHRLWPIETISGVNSGTRGNGGYNSGGNLAPAVTVAGFDPNPAKGRDTGATNPNFEPYPSATAAYYIGYITIGDYNTRVLPFTPTSVLLNWNGVPYSADNVRQGKYTAWVYNNLLRPSTGIADPDISSFADTLRDEIKDTTATENGGLLLNGFAVERSLDGGIVTPL